MAELAESIELSPEDNELLLRVPLTTLEWLGLPIFLVALTALFAYAGLAMYSGPVKSVESGVVIVVAVLSGAAGITVGVFAYRAFARFTPDAARAYFRALRWWCAAYAVMGIVIAIISQHFVGLVTMAVAAVVRLVVWRRRRRAERRSDRIHTTEV